MPNYLLNLVKKLWLPAAPSGASDNEIAIRRRRKRLSQVLIFSRKNR
jgi:hypothetical protein